MEAIRTEKLTKSYGKARGIIDLDLTVEPGEFFGFIGPNGAGKSTTIRTLLGLIRPTGGRAWVLGQDITGKRNDLLARVGYLPSEAVFYSGMRVREVLKLSAGLRKTDCKQAADALCQRLQLDPERKVDELSFGNRKKVGIVCALQHDPELLILDEPTSGLDPVVRDEVVELFSEFTRDESHSILISSHIVSDLEKLCDYIAFLHKGQLLLCEEKDLLLSEYCILRCTAAELNALPKAAVKGRKENPYGVTAIVRRDAAPVGANISPISIEELFVFMVKEA